MLFKNVRLFWVIKWLLIGIFPFVCSAQGVKLKQQALDTFKKENYPHAIELLERAVAETPDDAELYYYLGFFNHYLANDSRPLQGYDYRHSEKIFNYQRKALALNPNYGNAKYFYGAECSANAFKAMQNYDLKKMKYFYKDAFNVGAYPPWLLEFGRNLLNSCEKDAIFFAGGNADFDVCAYLQLHEGFRNDVTVIPIGNIDRPWYVKFLKNGLKDGIRPITIDITDEQIMDIHPYKWKSVTVKIPISSALRKKYNLEQLNMEWVAAGT